MTDEERKKMRMLISEHRKMLNAFTKAMKAEIDELGKMVKDDVDFGNAREYGVFPYNCNGLNTKARGEIAEKFCNEFDQVLYFLGTEKTADAVERTAEDILEEHGYGGAMWKKEMTPRLRG